MKKIQLFIFAIMLMFIPTFTACGENEIGVYAISFNQPTYAVLQGESVQLEYEISPIEATNKNVSFSVLEGADYVSVDETGKVTAKTIEDGKTKVAKVQVKTDYAKCSATCYIKVLTDPIKLEAPSQVKFDANISSVVWELVTYKDVDTNLDSKIPTYNPNYSLVITHNGQEKVVNNWSQTSYPIMESGVYNIKVKSQSDSSIFTDSETFAETSFTILDTPEQPLINNNQISVSKINASGINLTKDNYELVITNKITGKTIDVKIFQKTEDENSVKWQFPTLNSSNYYGTGYFEYKVRVLGDNLGVSDQVYFTSNFTNTSNSAFYQLGYVSADSIVLTSENISWPSVEKAVAYKLVIKSSDYTDEITVQTTSWKLSDDVKNLSQYGITIQALGNDSTIIDGMTSASKAQKLSTPTNVQAVNESESGWKLSWDAVAGAENYAVYIDDAKSSISFSSYTQYSIQAENFSAGEHTIKIVATSKKGSVNDESFIYPDSDPAIINIYKLATPTLQTTQGKIAWTSVINVQNYLLTIQKSGQSPESFSIDKSESTFELGSNFGEGEYNVTIQAKGGDLVNGKYIFDSTVSNGEIYTKQSAPINLNLNQSGILSWENGEYASTVGSYEVYIQDVTDENESSVRKISTSQKNCNVSNYLSGSGFGKYYFKVQATNNLVSQKYLRSEISDSVTSFKLSAPTGLGITNGELSWNELSAIPDVTKEELKTKTIYQIRIDKIENQTASTAFSPSKNTCRAGNHTANIKLAVLEDNKVAISGVTVFLLSSDYSEDFEFEKLSTPSAPNIQNGTEIFGGLVEGVTAYSLFVQKPGGYGGTSFTLTDEQVSATGWSITVKEVFSQIGTSSAYGNYKISIRANGGNSAINSDNSPELTFYQIETPKLEVSNGLVSWNIVFSEIYGNVAPVDSYEIAYKKIGESTFSYIVFDAEQNTWDMKGLKSGTYQMQIKAVAPTSSNLILSSSVSQLKTVEKLGDVDLSTLKVETNSGTELNPNLYNTITWEQVENAKYELYIYQDFVTTKELVDIQTLSANEYTFSSNLTSNDYTLVFKTVADDKVSGDQSQEFKIHRLSQVTGLSIDEDTVLSWGSVQNVSEYRFIYKDTQILSKTKQPSDEKIKIVGDILTLDTEVGVYAIQVIAIVDKNNTQILNADSKLSGLNISSAPSTKFTVTRYSVPTLSVTNGELTWINNEATNFGYELSFKPDAGAEIVVKVASGQSTIDLSSNDFVVGTTYSVKIKSIGDGQRNLDSPQSDGTFRIQKLKEPVYRVVDGQIVWDNDENATSYSAVTSSLSKNITTYGIRPSANSSTVNLPSEALLGLEGDIEFTLRANGTIAPQGSKINYINSPVNTTYKIKKHSAPTDLDVNLGEIDWTRDESGTILVSGTMIEFLRGYNVLIKGQETTGTQNSTIGIDEEFILSDILTTNESTDTLEVSVCKLGNKTGESDDVFGSVYLNSDYSSTIIVRVNGKPTNLDVEDGKLVWSEYDGGFYRDYELIIKYENGQEESVEVYENSTSLEGKTDNIESICVRHKGTISSSGYGVRYVNSKKSDLLYKLKKLAVPQISVTSDGKLKWNKTAYSNFNFVDNTKPGFTFTVNGFGDSNSTNNFTDENFELSGDYSSYIGQGESESIQTLNIESFVQGSINKSQTSDGYILLNSDFAPLEAFRFAPVESFDVDDSGLKFVWEVSNFSNGKISNDRFIISYQLDDGEWLERIVDNVRELPFWKLARYNAKISVYSSGENVIRSVSTDCSKSNHVFKKFIQGQGTSSDPFIISDTTNETFIAGSTTFEVEKSTAETKFEYIYTIPSAYFKLACDINLPNLDENKNGNNLSEKDGQRVATTFTGGLDGDNHTIKNFQIYEFTSSYSLFYNIKGGAVQTLGSITDDPFYARTGIIQNLKLEISKFEKIDYKFVDTKIAFFAQNCIGGWIVNCHISLSDDFSSQSGQKAIIFDYIETSNRIEFAGFVNTLVSVVEEEGLLEGEEPTNKSDYEFRDARIMNCTANIDVRFTKSITETDYRKEPTIISGIVTNNKGGTIYNCKNLGDLAGTQVAGICATVDKVRTFTLVSNVWVESDSKSGTVSGCENDGNLLCFPTATLGSNNIVSDSGGIVGTLISGNVVYSLNKGTITAQSCESFASSDYSSYKTTISVGGIVGKFENGNIINCLNVGKFSLESESLNIYYNGQFKSNVGGIVGTAVGGTMKNSYFDGDINKYLMTDKSVQYNANGNNEANTESRLATSNIQGTDLITKKMASDNEIGVTFYDVQFGSRPRFQHQENNYPNLIWDSV